MARARRACSPRLGVATAARHEERDPPCVCAARVATGWRVVAFGRFDVRLATGERGLPGEPEPFDPLPYCSPGMLVGEDGLPLTGPLPGYPFNFPESGVMVDDPGDPRDLTAAVRVVFDAVFG